MISGTIPSTEEFVCVCFSSRLSWLCELLCLIASLLHPIIVYIIADTIPCNVVTFVSRSLDTRFICCRIYKSNHSSALFCAGAVLGKNIWGGGWPLIIWDATRPVESHSGARGSITCSTYCNPIPTETSCQLLTGKTHRRKVG